MKKEVAKTINTKKVNIKPAETKKVLEITEQVLKLLKVEAKVDVALDEENQAIKIQIDPEEPGILIGFHGETLSSLQLLLGIMVSRKIGEWVRVLVNIGDYRQKREEVLRHIGLNAAQKVRFSGEPVVLLDLSASDRRIVHMALSEYDDIVTESEGEGKDRRLVIKPRRTE